MGKCWLYQGTLEPPSLLLWKIIFPPRFLSVSRALQTISIAWSKGNLCLRVESWKDAWSHRFLPNLPQCFTHYSKSLARNLQEILHTLWHNCTCCFTKGGVCHWCCNYCQQLVVLALYSIYCFIVPTKTCNFMHLRSPFTHFFNLDLALKPWAANG